MDTTLLEEIILNEEFIKENIGDKLIAIEKIDDDFVVTCKDFFNKDYTKTTIISDNFIKLSLSEVKGGLLFSDMGLIRRIIDKNEPSIQGDELKNITKEQCRIWGVENWGTALLKMSSVENFKKNFNEFVNILLTIVELSGQTDYE